MGLAGPAVALLLIVVGYASGSTLLFDGLRPVVGATANLLGVQMTPSMVDVTALAVFACIAFWAVVALWRRFVPSYL